MVVATTITHRELTRVYCHRTFKYYPEGIDRADQTVWGYKSWPGMQAALLLAGSGLAW
jgi:hypothetical protein